VARLALAPPAPSESLTTIADRYQLLATLHEGSTATVLRAHDSRLSRAVAIKVRPLDGPVARQEFEAEVQTMVSLNRHAGLLHLYDAGIHVSDDGETGYITTELMAMTIGAAIGRHALRDQQIAQVGRLVGQALAHMHERGIAHHGVTPANVLLIDPVGLRGAQPCARLAGFSRARVVGIGPNARASGAGEDVRALGMVLLGALVGSSGTLGSVDPAWRRLINAMCALDESEQLSAAEAASRMPVVAELSNVG
jgi:hypothetical protein